MMLRRFALASVLLIASSAAPAMAGTATDNLGVSGSVDANCTIVATPVAFAPYDPVTANATGIPLNATGKVATVCTTGASAVITLGQGINHGTGSDAVPARQMIGGTGTDNLSYSLFSDAGLTTVWGNTVATGVPITGTGTSVDTAIYGSIPGGQNVPAGTYNDTVVATVTF
ncbi:Csu type fimbrial protein [Nostoc sp.]|uniref:Csu type fimbrial protein n=1 Tax=Nostoc sp. TaxID=1180 RepID=UPI002FF912B9